MIELDVVARVRDVHHPTGAHHIRRYKLFAKPIKQRIQMCADKGFDGLEPDNINGYENDTGFPLTAKDQLKFNRWIAKETHKRGMSVALKNDGPQAKKLVRDFDYAVVEQCFQYNECGQYRPFVRAGKAVFSVEYELKNSKFCGRAKKIKFASIGKEYDLFASRSSLATSNRRLHPSRTAKLTFHPAERSDLDALFERPAGASS